MSGIANSFVNSLALTIRAVDKATQIYGEMADIVLKGTSGGAAVPVDKSRTENSPLLTPIIAENGKGGKINASA